MIAMMNQTICRCCLAEHPTISYNIFDRDNLKADLIECVPKLNIELNDGLPDVICDLCWLRVREAVDFKRKCEEADHELRERINVQKIDEVQGLNLENIDSGKSQVLEDIAFNDEEAILYNATLELCELSPLEVSILNEVLTEDVNNTTGATFVRDEDPVIIELLNTVLHDTLIDSNSQESPLQSDANKSTPEGLSTLDNQSADVSSTTVTPTKPSRKKRQKSSKQLHTCSECGKSFTRNFQLKLHLTSVHNIGDGLQYQCNDCQKTFASRHSLSYHRKSLHTEERDFACPKCDKRFVLRSQLASHERIHTGEFKPRIHECSKCGKNWPTKSDLRTHMRTHDPNVEMFKKFQCDQCEKRFFTRGHLASHLLVHSGEKPFTCALCEKSYQSVGNLNNHMVKRHSEVTLNRSRHRNSSDPRTLIET